MDFKATQYKLRNVANSREFNDSGWLLDDPQSTEPTLIRADYEVRQINVGDSSLGIYRFGDWLPISRRLEGSSSPVTILSKKLGEYLGIKNLYITFNGYYPEIGANMTTCSFKETEAYSVCGRSSGPYEGKILVVASAGNTARAFAKVCSENNIPLLLSVPEDNLDALWFEKPLNPCVQLICAEKGGDYFDAIHIGNLALGSDKFYAEGGAKNIARRDGMATTMLSATTTIGRIPDYYFQAVGSGTGAIAAWEANQRLIEDGRFGDTKMKLMVSQNYPFVPMYNAWKADSRAMLEYDDDTARKDAETIRAKVLSNRKPPYSITGGLYDALKDSKGDVFVVTNTELQQAATLFEQMEGIDIYAASAVAVSSLMKAVKEGLVDKDKTFMLNITGCGEQRLREGRELYQLKPSVIFKLDVKAEEVIAQIEKLF